MFGRFVLLALGIAAVACAPGSAIPSRYGAGFAAAGQTHVASSAPEIQSGGEVIGVAGLKRSLRFADLSPGWSQTETYSVENTGNASLQLVVSGANFADRGGEFTWAEAAVDPTNAGDLGDHVRVTATINGAEAYDGPLEGLVAWGSTDLGVVPAGQTRAVSLRFSVDPGTGAEIQGDEATFDLRFSLRRRGIALASNRLATE
ncbi:MAG: hypothetical protein P4L93_05900 [Coriobacteriia bacterium]|nr:hypothetical protein [Coriobacteriia bacterium]